ncbi:hypothetical protein K1719_002241 [Acacia pycnantha]|nr:hypothetical protein K1719_002241 [Acacia pycnantha]
MSLITWNCQGAFDKKFPSIFKALVFNCKPDVFVIVEPRISGTKADRIIKKLGFQFSHRVEATAFFGCPQQQYRKFLWQDLDLLTDNISSPWLLAGDFNAILSSDERRGGATHRARGCNFFNEFIHSNGLMDMGSNGPKFTWPRGTLLMRLDRAICNTLCT